MDSSASDGEPAALYAVCHGAGERKVAHPKEIDLT